MGDFYSVYGGGRGPMPSQQQLYDQFNANANPNPYQTTGPVYNGQPMFTAPSWY